MKILRITVGVVLFAWNCAGFSQPDVPCGQVIDAPIHSGAVLTIDSRPAGVEVVGSDQETLHVSCTSGDADDAEHVRLRLSGTPAHSRLVIAGDQLKNGNLHIRIEVPRRINLGIHMPAGQLNVDEILGDKDIHLYAGQITISSAHKWDYKNVDVSVSIGQLNAQVYGAQTNGFFRSLQNKNPNGEYRLSAHVLTGQIDLLGKSERASAAPQ